jgi:hypothetical protein
VTPPHPPRTLTRADLPPQLTADSLRHLDLRRLSQLRRPNQVLTPEEQVQFETAFDTLLTEVRKRLQDADGRSRSGGPRGLDPELRGSYQRAQRRLQEQARRARQALPELDDEPPAPSVSTPDDQTPDDQAVSTDSLTEDLDESSTILELLDRIAGIEEQQLEHQKSQLLLDTRGFFFAFLVSASVIVAGVAPLVEADRHERLQILAWTVLAIVLAGLVYAVVRVAQRRS